MSLNTNVHVDVCVLTHELNPSFQTGYCNKHQADKNKKVWGRGRLLSGNGPAQQNNKTWPELIKGIGCIESRFKEVHLMGWGSGDGQSSRERLESQPKQTTAGLWGLVLWRIGLIGGLWWLGFLCQLDWATGC